MGQLVAIIVYDNTRGPIRGMRVDGNKAEALAVTAERCPDYLVAWQVGRSFGVEILTSFRIQNKSARLSFLICRECELGVPARKHILTRAGRRYGHFNLARRLHEPLGHFDLSGPLHK
jgi:hypothetical protein